MTITPEDLSHVFWIGGSACAGKTSVVESISRRHGLAVYHCDDHFDEHKKRVEPLRHPRFFRIMQRTPEELWMRPAAEQVEELVGFYRESLEMVFHDLAEAGEIPPSPPLRKGGTKALRASGSGKDPKSLAEGPKGLAPPFEKGGRGGISPTTVLAEGAGLMPALLAALDPALVTRGVWLVGTAEFRRQRYPSRGPWVRQLLDQCPEPETAWANWMERDDQFATRVSQEAKRLGARWLSIDGSRSVDEIAQEVVSHLQSSPRGET